MRKWMGIICVVCICLGMSGCAGGGQSHLNETDRGPYTDGVYEVQMPTYDKSWQEYGKVTVTGGYITEVEYDALNESGEKKSEDAAYRDDMAVGNAVNGLPATYPEKAYQDLTQAFQAAQYDPEKVDSVAGATLSSQNFKKVMTALMEKVREGTPGKTALPLYQDGTYEVEMPEYDNGWKDFVRLTIIGGEVESIQYDARDEDGQLKSADEKYERDMISGNAANGLPETYPADYIQKLVDSYMQSGSAEEIDSVAGATISTHRFQKLLRHALKSARQGRTELFAVPLFEDGEYRAQMGEETDGWTEFVILVIQDNMISQITFDAMDEKGDYRSKDTGGSQTEREEGFDSAVFYPAILEEFIDKQFLPDEMETVAGASRSTKNFKKLAAAALENALYGSQETAFVNE